MTTEGKNHSPFLDLEGTDFYQPDDFPDNNFVPWLDPQHSRADFVQAFQLFVDVFIDLMQVVDDYSRGDRIDVAVKGKRHLAHKGQSIELLEHIGTEWGVQFVCFTKTGAAFVKL